MIYVIVVTVITGNVTFPLPNGLCGSSAWVDGYVGQLALTD